MQVNLNVPQSQFIQMPHKYKAFVAGFGAGKTTIGCISQITHYLKHPRVPQGYFAPTFSLIRDIFYPTIEETASMFGMTTKTRVGDKEVDLYLGRKYYGTTICRTMDNPDNIIGFQIGRALVDELDVLKTEKARTAWNKIIARLRYKDENVQNGIDVATTPEGFKFTYDRFKKSVEDNPGISNTYGFIKASTYQNEKNLPDDYIQSLLDSYPEQLIQAYLNGEFVNLLSGQVYYFDSTKHACNTTHEQYEPIYIGMDFNVRNMSAVINVKRNNELHAVGEFTNVLDTPTMIDYIKDRYRGCTIIIYPDSSGGNTSSKSASESDISLLEAAGLMVDAPARNPFIKDRVNAVNGGFEHGKLKVNITKCPRLAETLVQQVYDTNGKPEKSAGNNIDDLNDAYGYAVNMIHPVTRPAVDLQVRFN